MSQFACLFLLTVALWACSKSEEPIPVVPDQEFNLVYGSAAAERAYGAAQSADGNYVLAGATENVGIDRGIWDAWVLKLDKQGKILWEKTYGGSADEAAYSITPTKDGGYITAGHTFSNNGDVAGNHGNTDFWVIKLDKNGVKQWQKTLGGSGPDAANSIIETSNGGYLVAGQTASTGGDVTNYHGGTDAWVVKLDGNGNIQWQKALGGSGSDGALSIIEISSGGYIMAGRTSSSDGDVSGYHAGWGLTLGNSDGWIVKLDKDGNLLWTKAYGGFGNEVFNSVTQGLDSTYTIAGFTKSHNDNDVGSNHGDNDAWIVKIDKEGKIAWQKLFGGSAFDLAHSIASANDSGYIFTGATFSNDGDVSNYHGSEDAWVVKLDKKGNKQWQRSLGGSSGDEGHTIFKRINGGYMMAGMTGSNDGDVTGQHGAGDAWAMTLKDQ